MIKVRANLVCITLATAFMVGGLTGCPAMNNTQRGAVVGTGLGTGLGAIIGHQMGKKKEGALVGAIVGGGTGTLIGNSQDIAEERDAAYQQASFERDQRRAQAKRMMNKDIIEMSQQGVSDQTIIQAIHGNGVEFRNTTSEIIWLKRQGVSQAVMDELQTHTIQ